MVEFLKRQNKADLAYIYNKRDSDQAPIVFLGGFRSDMMGTKAEFLSDLCEKHARSYLRFDYSGHGQSGGQFEDCVLSDWFQDVRDILEGLSIINPILVGSSMGGWLSLRYIEEHGDNLHGFVGIAAAPNFTRWMTEAFSETQQADVESQGYVLAPNDYGDPYVITKALLDDGEKHILLEKELNFSGGVRLLQGKKDVDVPWKTAENIAEALPRANVEVIYREEGNHSLSSDGDLQELACAVESFD